MNFADYDSVKKVAKENSSLFLAGGVIDVNNKKLVTLDYNKIALDSGLINAYVDSKGLPDLRAAYLAKAVQQNRIDIDNIMVTAGATAALYASLKLSMKYGTKVVACAPCWSLYETICKTLNLEIDFCFPSDKLTWHHTAQDILAHIGPDTGAILLAYPSNPTGVYISNEELIKLVQICNEKKILLIVDETYYGLAFVDNK